MTSITNTATQDVGAKYSSTSKVTFTRPANTTAYAAGDVVSSATATASIKFPGCGTSGKILRAALAYEHTNASNFTLLLFDAEPTGHSDNAALALASADLANYVGRIDLNSAAKLIVNTAGSGKSVYRGALDYDALGAIPYRTTGGALYGLLVTTNGFTPVSGTTVHIRLGVEADHQ